MHAYLTEGNGSAAHAPVELAPVTAADAGAGTARVTVDIEHPQQRIIGFGSALTEASAHVFAQMSEAAQDEFMLRCFGPASRGGNAYTLCRTHLQSCDFALGNYAYVHRVAPWRDPLETFSIERDRALLIPFIRCCMALAPELSLVASPWSPAAFMKTNLNMNRGSHLLPWHRDTWARTLARAVRAWRDEGMPIERLTVQNEPEARQTWDSCLYSPKAEAAFAERYLAPALVAEGCGDVRILAWDHNKDHIVDRVRDIEDALAGTYGTTFAGTAFHWYTGDQFENVRTVRDMHPDLELIHTEGCDAYSHGRGETRAREAEHYAHDMIGDLNAGANGYIDWNILLDEQGGPNHVGNWCDAPIMYHRGEHRLVINRSFEYIGHISRYIAPGARVLPSTMSGAGVESLAALNPNGKLAIVLLNRTKKATSVLLESPRHADSPVALTLPAHSIATVLL